MEKMTPCSLFLRIAGAGISYKSSKQTRVISFGVNSRSVTRIIIKALPSSEPEICHTRSEWGSLCKVFRVYKK